MGELCSITQRKAKKTHICNICGKRICPGSEYVFARSGQDGRFWYNKQHIHCDAIASAYTQEYGGIEQVDNVIDWLIDKVCIVCPERVTCDAGMWDVFACEIIHKNVLPATLLAAAKESVRRNDDG